MPAAKKTILVTGDVVVDHHMYQGARATPDAPQRLGTRLCQVRGGAWLLYRLLHQAGQAAPPADGGCDVVFGLDETSLDGLPSHWHSYASWRPSPAADGGKGHVWRLHEALGYGDPPDGSRRFVPRGSAAQGQPAQVVVVDDAGLGFRFADAQAAWPAVLRNGSSEATDWIVLKMSSPLAGGDLWRTLMARDDLRRKLVCVVSIDDIRQHEVRIVRGLSWERTAQDLVGELESNPALQGLLQCRHLVVSFRSEGAIHVQRREDADRRYRLLFDSGHLEGQWGRHIQGRAFGHLSALTAAIVWQLATDDDTRQLERGIAAGLSAMRTLNQLGHGPVGDAQPDIPCQALVEEFRHPRNHYAAVDIPRAAGGAGPNQANGVPWTLIAASQSGAPFHSEPLYGIARGVALAGTAALANIPYARFGKLFTVDRDEIESLRTIERLIRDYLAGDSGKQPLSLAVFGQPGSGKSFSVKQIAASVLGDDPAILEFNLSQFSGPEELIGAFHQVRDAVLSGQTPLVFWDEFDSREYFWLQYLLAPMQDGRFHCGQITHPIGKCVFVFAGGTSFDFAHFGPRPDDEAGWKLFRSRKGPDFISRLSGYLNVLGPNPRAIYDSEQHAWIDDPADICFPVRRALFLRVLLEHFGNQRLEIDRGVLSAFLEVSRLKHGARSMEKLLLLARQQSGSTTIRRSDLPAASLMDLYVDSGEFMGIVTRNLPVRSRADELAPAVHRFYTDLAIDDFRRTHGRDPDDSELKHPRDFARLAPEFQDSNRAAAERIPLVLEMAGLYVLRDSDGTGTAPEIADILEQNLELLAAAEHDQWLRFMQLNGWQFAPQRDDRARLHNLLLPYEQLSEADKNKDRNQVRNYPKILAGGGYKIVTWSQWNAQPSGT